MKLRKYIVPVLTLSLLATGCGGENEPTDWSKSVKEFMEDTLGEVLPFAKVNLKEGGYTLTQDSDELGGYFTFQDVNENNLVATYGEALVAAGFTATSSSVYTKTNELVSMTLTIKYQKKTSSAPAGNKLTADYQYVTVVGDWSEGIKEVMTEKLGFVLPYAYLDSDTTLTTFEEGEFENIFEIKDTNSESKLKTYGSRLVYSGYSKSTSGGKTIYSKRNANNDLVKVSFGYVPANEGESGSNVITCNIELDLKDWPESVKTDMLNSLGIVLPFAKFNFINAEIELETDEFGGYYSIYEENTKTDIFADYATALTSETYGFEYDNTLNGYVKTTEQANVRVYPYHDDEYEENSLYVEFVNNGAVVGNWSEEIQQLMTEKVGEVLPYAHLNLETLSVVTKESSGGVSITISDVNDDNKLVSYGPRLEDMGYEYHSGFFGGSYYEKTLADKTVIDIQAGWYAEYEDEDSGDVTPAGNEIYISVTFPPVKYTSFPTSEIIAFAALSEVTIENCPVYNVASEEAYFEVDSSLATYGILYIYIFGSSTAELNTFISSLGEDWAADQYGYYYYKDTDINFGVKDNSSDTKDPKITLTFYDE